MTEPSPTPPSVESSVLADVASLRSVGRLLPDNESLVASALMLARRLDEGAGLGTSAVARELRATLAALRDPKPEDDDLDEILAALRGSRPMDHGGRPPRA